MIRFLLLLTLLCGNALGQSQSLTGTVVDSVTLGPISRARVTLTSQSGRDAVLTDPSGSFTFADVPPGRYAVTAERVGYTISDGLHADHFAVVELDKIPATLKLQLRPAPKISGSVVDEDGLPLPSASIFFLKKVIAAGRSKIQQVRQEQSDDLGKFRVSFLESGRYLVCATAEANSYQRHHNLTYSSICFPNAQDIASAEWLDLRDGEERNLGLQLTPVHSIRLSGTVDRANADLATNITMDLRRIDSSGSPPASFLNVILDNKTSKFDALAITPGEYIVSADSATNEGTLHADRTFHAGAEDILDLHLALREPTYISGTVQMDGVASSPDRISVQQLGVADKQLLIYAHGSGDFRQPANSPGEFEVKVVPPPGWMVQSVTQRGVDLREQKLTISMDVSPEPIRIVLTRGGGTIEAVLDSAKEDSMKVVLLRRSSTGNFWVQEGQEKIVWAMKEGRTNLVSAKTGQLIQIPIMDTAANKLTNVPAGDYLLLGLPLVGEIEYLNPEAMQQYQEFGQYVSVREGETTKVTLKPLKLK